MVSVHDKHPFPMGRFQYVKIFLTHIKLKGNKCKIIRKQKCDLTHVPRPLELGKKVQIYIGLYITFELLDPERLAISHVHTFWNDLFIYDKI